MTVLLVLGVWLLLSCVTCVLFAAVIRGDVDTALPEDLLAGAVPLPRVGTDAVAEQSLTSAT